MANSYTTVNSWINHDVNYLLATKCTHCINVPQALHSHWVYTLHCHWGKLDPNRDERNRGTEFQWVFACLWAKMGICGKFDEDTPINGCVHSKTDRERERDGFDSSR